MPKRPNSYTQGDNDGTGGGGFSFLILSNNVLYSGGFCVLILVRFAIERETTTKNLTHKEAVLCNKLLVEAWRARVE